MAGKHGNDNELTETWEEFRVTGDPYAYRTIYTSFASALFNYGKKITSNEELVKDAIHDVFVRLWKNRKNLKATSSIRYYLLSSLRREVLRKITREPFKRPLDETIIHSSAFQLSHERDMIIRETVHQQHETLKQAINQLPSRQREAVFLRFYENMSFEEIAKLMSVETRSVYKLIYKALDKLQHLVIRVTLIFILLLTGICG